MPEGASFASLAPQIVHCHVVEVKRHHVDALRRLVHALDAKHVLVFMNHQDRLKDAVYKLASKGMTAAALHGELGKQQRQSVLQQFRNGKTRVLLVSDVVSRGLDVESCDAVVNLELPSNAAHYAHRAGRTGRMGRPGVVCTIVERQHSFVIDKMSKALQVDIPQCKSVGGRATIIRDGKVVVLGRFYDPPSLEKPKAQAVPDKVEDAVEHVVAQEV
jgi:superfamily II DNA/RNA helicase